MTVTFYELNNKARQVEPGKLYFNGGKIIADAGVAFMLDEPIKVCGQRELIYPTEAEKFTRALPLVFKSPTPQANIWAKNVCD